MIESQASSFNFNATAQLSNSFSTGGGGVDFEHRVQ